MLDKNTGILIQPIADSDFRVGANTQLTFVNRDVNWTLYRPTIERQYYRYFDSMACVSFSLINSVEIQLNWMLASGQLNNVKHIFDDYIVDGKWNLSDRFLAKMSETTKRGNFMAKVADTARHVGFIPEKDWTFSQEFNWETYYADIPQDIQDKGKLFLEYFDIAYEWVHYDKQALKFQLQHAPLQVATSTCPGWNLDGIIQSCVKETNHAYVIDGFKNGESWEIFDTYEPFHKKLAWDYSIPHILKIVITLKKNNEVPAVDRRYDLVFDGFQNPTEKEEWFNYLMTKYQNDEYIKRALGRAPTEQELIAMSYGQWSPQDLTEANMQNWHNNTYVEFRAKILHVKLT